MTHALKRTAGDSDQPVLKLHGRRRNRATSDLSPSMTLPEFYRAFFRPVILVAQRCAVRTLDAYDQSIGYWQRFTEDPSLAEIDDYDIGEFMEAVGKLPGGRPGEPISPNTIRKHCTHLQAVLTRAGPRSHEGHRRKAQNLIPEIPFFEKPREREKVAEDDFTVEEIGKLMAHCNGAVAPSYLTGEQQAVWWRNLFLFDFNVGLRIGSVVRVEWAKIKTDSQGRTWVYVEVKRGHTHKFFLNEFALKCLEAMRPLTGQFDHVWHWPHGLHWLQENRRRILEAADFPQDRRFGFHGLRKAMCTVVSEFDPFAAQMQADHKDMAMTQRRYINPKRVASAMRKLPQPKPPTRQGTLFER